jgi:hypothetical protein
MTPVAFNFLRLVAGRAGVINNLQDGFGQPFRGTSRPSLNWRGSSTSNRRHLLLIGCLSLDGKLNVLVCESFQSSLWNQVLT